MNWFERREPRPPQSDDARDDSDVDYGRVIHSASFRRLQGKTQILNLGDGDFYRTRLTHSLEVAQIGGSIAKQLAKSFPNDPATAYLPVRSMIHAVGCAHDLGHPPFGHGGEVALNYCMRDSGVDKRGGFEGNGQTLRILSRIEKFSKSAGANLSRRTLLGILKYPVAYSDARNIKLVPKLIDEPSTLRLVDAKASKPPKCYMDSETEVVAWLLDPLCPTDLDAFQEFDQEDGKHNKPKHKSLDCSIMEAADNIAYGIHDLEDAIALKLISKDCFEKAVKEDSCWCFLDALKDKYPMPNGNNTYLQMIDDLFGDSFPRKQVFGRLVHHFIVALKYRADDQFLEPLVRYQAEMASPQSEFLRVLTDLVTKHVIKSPNVQHLEFKGQGMVIAVFEAMLSDPKRLLPIKELARFEKSGGGLRVICDYVAGMTDSYLLMTYERLFAPRMGSVFDNL